MIHFKPFKFGKAEMAILGLFFLMLLLSVGISTVPYIAALHERLTETWTQAATRYGYAGAFGAALIGSTSATVFFPYTIIVIFLATQGLSPFWLGLLMGLGAGVGQMFGYMLGRWGSGWFHRKKPETYDAMERILAERPGLIFFFIIFFGSTPLPDDLILIPLGMLRYPWWKAWLPSTIGKCFAGWIVTYSSRVVYQSLELTSAGSTTGLLSQFATIASLAVIMYIMFRLDWVKIMHRLLDRASNGGTSQ